MVMSFTDSAININSAIVGTIFGGEDKDKETNEKEATSRRLQEQCILVQYMDKFQGFSRQLKYNNFTAIDGDGSYIMNVLGRRAGTEVLMQLTPAQLAALVPMVHIYKTFLPTEDSPGVDVELRFDEHLRRKDIDRITNSWEGVGSGIGLKNFHIKFSGGPGKNFATSENVIEFDMTLRFNTLEDLDSVQQMVQIEGKDREVRFIDLFMPETQFSEKGYREYNENYFRMKAVVGWAVPENIPMHTNALSSAEASQLKQQDILEALKNSTFTAYLTYTHHDLSFQENGAVEISFGGTGYADQVLRSKYCDIIWSKAMEDLQKLKKEATSPTPANIADSDEKDEKNTCPQEKKLSDEEKKKQEEAQAEQEKILRKEIGGNYRYFLEQLEKSKRIFYVDIPQEALRSDVPNSVVSYYDDKGAHYAEVADLKSLPPDWLTKQMTVDQQGSISSDVEEALKVQALESEEKLDEAAAEFAKTEASVPASDGRLRVNYMFLGSILDVALDSLYFRYPTKGKNIKFLLGSIVFTNPLTKKILIISLADLPVSVHTFMVFYVKNVIAKRDRTNYPLWQFIKDLLNDFLPPILGDSCFKGAGSSALVEANVQTFAVARKGGTSVIPNGRLSIEQLNELHPGKAMAASSFKEAANIDNLIVITANGPTAKALQGKWDEDAKIGIYHFAFGQDRGLLKKITFKQSAVKHMVEARMTREPIDPLTRFRARYDADIELCGTMAFRPGDLVYISAVSLGAGSPLGRATIAKKLMIGGYYRVQGSESTLERGAFTTTMACTWECMEGGKQYQEPCKKANIPSGKPVQYASSWDEATVQGGGGWWWEKIDNKGPEGNVK